MIFKLKSKLSNNYLSILIFWIIYMKCCILGGFFLICMNLVEMWVL